jgi:uncharacterized protein (DUF58 family)
MTTAPLTVPLGRQGPGRLSGDAVARLELALRRRAGGVLAGDHRTAGLGDATELAQLRPYEAGDDVRRLDPAASARTAIPHVRLHVPERAVTTWLVLDVSASMAFGTGERLKSDVAEGVTEVVVRLAVRRGGRIAVTTAGPQQPRLVRPLGGRGALATVRALVREGVTPDGPGASQPGGLAAALERVSRLARTRGVVAVVSDFRDEGWRGPLRRAAARHTVLAIEVVDPREGELLDAGTLFLVDPETGEEVEVDTSSARVREAFAGAEAERRAAVATELRRAGADHVVLGTDRDWLRDLGRALR